MIIITIIRIIIEIHVKGTRGPGGQVPCALQVQIMIIIIIILISIEIHVKGTRGARGQAPCALQAPLVPLT